MRERERREGKRVVKWKAITILASRQESAAEKILVRMKRIDASSLTLLMTKKSTGVRDCIKCMWILPSVVICFCVFGFCGLAWAVKLFTMQTVLVIDLALELEDLKINAESVHRLIRLPAHNQHFASIFSMSSDENIIAMPADNSIASDSISAKLIEVSRVAESLDGVLHETQDRLNIFETTMNVAMASTSKGSSANTSDVRKLLGSCKVPMLITWIMIFRTGTRAWSHPPKTSRLSRPPSTRHRGHRRITRHQSVAAHRPGHGMSQLREAQSTSILLIPISLRWNRVWRQRMFRSMTPSTVSARRFHSNRMFHRRFHRKCQAQSRTTPSPSTTPTTRFTQSSSRQRHHQAWSRKIPKRASRWATTTIT